MEVLFIAQSLGIPIAEVAVNWEEVDGENDAWAAASADRTLHL